MRLRDIQTNFKETILNHELLYKYKFHEIFSDDHGISIENRIKVYRNNVIRSLTDAAMAPLPMCQKLVGKEFIETAMRSYIVKNLPKEGNLNLYGQSFPEFLKNYNPAQQTPYLPDMACLEWAWEKAYYAKDDLPLDVRELEKLGDESFSDLRFTLRASASLMESSFPLHAIVDFCRTDDHEENLDITSSSTKTYLLIYRPELKVELRKIDQAEYNFLKGIKKNVPLGDLSETILASEPNFNIGKVLEKHFILGTFSNFEI
jgi:hypothetical protein